MLGSETETQIAALEAGDLQSRDAMRVIAKKLRAWGEALQWIAIHDGSGEAHARRVQTIAARALYHEEAPAFGKEKKP